MKKLYFILCLILFSQCGKNVPCKVQPDLYIFFPEETLSKVPYKNNTELTFINTLTNDTHTFYGQSWDSSNWYYRDYSKECQGGYFMEDRRQRFISPTYKYPINFGIIYTSRSQGSEYFVVDLTAFSYYLWVGNIHEPYTFDSLLIQNKWYLDIKYFKDQYLPGRNTKYGCFYNTSQGIIKIELPEGNLELLKIKY